MTIATGTFVVLNANYPACSWPGVSEGAVPIELAGPLGPVGNAHRVYEVCGLPASCAIKMGPGAECPEDEKDARQVAMRLGARDSLWGEYEKLLAADGLCGRAPLAYAYGAFVEAGDAGRARISPAFVMERLDAEPLCHVVERGAPPVRRVIEAGLMLVDLVDDLARRRIAHGTSRRKTSWSKRAMPTRSSARAWSTSSLPSRAMRRAAASVRFRLPRPSRSACRLSDAIRASGTCAVSAASRMRTCGRWGPCCTTWPPASVRHCRCDGGRVPTARIRSGTADSVSSSRRRSHASTTARSTAWICPVPGAMRRADLRWAPPSGSARRMPHANGR